MLSNKKSENFFSNFCLPWNFWNENPSIPCHARNPRRGKIPLRRYTKATKKWRQVCFYCVRKLQTLHISKMTLNILQHFEDWQPEVGGTVIINVFAKTDFYILFIYFGPQKILSDYWIEKIPTALRDGALGLRLHSAQIFFKNVTQKIKPNYSSRCKKNWSNHIGVKNIGGKNIGGKNIRIKNIGGKNIGVKILV